jgi:prepilin signal peptidase PulO-like enzyme (type II secretory pathway)
VIYVVAGAFGFLGAVAAHDLAIQTLRELSLRPFAGTCPRCGHQRGWFTIVCPNCSRRISRELLLALVGIVVAVGFAETIGASWSLIPYLGFLTLTLALGVTDIDAFRIVDRLNLRGTAILAAALAAAAILDGSVPELARAGLGALAYFGGSNLMFLLAGGKGFGYGDVKLSVQLGLFTVYLSWGALGWAVLITALLGGLVSVVVLIVGVIARTRARRRPDGDKSVSIRDVMKAELPYGPAMIVGAWTAIILVGLGAIPIPT